MPRARVGLQLAQKNLSAKTPRRGITAAGDVCSYVAETVLDGNSNRNS